MNFICYAVICLCYQMSFVNYFNFYYNFSGTCFLLSLTMENGNTINCTLGFNQVSSALLSCIILIKGGILSKLKQLYTL